MNTVLRVLMLPMLAASMLVSAAAAEPQDRGAVVSMMAPKPIVWSEFLGVNAHFLWFKPEQYAAQMAALRRLGLDWVRVDLHWAYMEPKEGQFQYEPLDHLVGELERQRLHSVFYLTGSPPFVADAPFWSRGSDQYPPKDPQLYASRMAALAKRYGAVDAWQVWNEPNLPYNWFPRADPDAYEDLLKDATAAIRAAVPGKSVVMGGMGYFSQMPLRSGLMLEELGKRGAFGLRDIVAYHPYSLYPEGDDPAARDFIERCRQMNTRLRQAGVPAIWATEFGWSSYAGPKEEQPIIGERGQADFVLRRLVLMTALDFDRIFLFALSDLDPRASVRDRSYGLLDLKGSPKPVYSALANFLSITGPRLEPAAAPAIASAVPGLYSIAWTRSDGRHLWMFWGAREGQVSLPDLREASLCHPLIGQCDPVKAGAGGLTVPVTPTLQILEWG